MVFERQVRILEAWMDATYLHPSVAQVGVANISEGAREKFPRTVKTATEKEKHRRGTGCYWVDKLRGRQGH